MNKQINGGEKRRLRYKRRTCCNGGVKADGGGRRLFVIVVGTGRDVGAVLAATGRLAATSAGGRRRRPGRRNYSCGSLTDWLVVRTDGSQQIDSEAASGHRHKFRPKATLIVLIGRNWRLRQMPRSPLCLSLNDDACGFVGRRWRLTPTELKESETSSSNCPRPIKQFCQP